MEKETYPNHTTAEIFVENQSCEATDLEEIEEQTDPGRLEDTYGTEETNEIRKKALDDFMDMIAGLRGLDGYDRLPIPFNYTLIYDMLYGIADPVANAKRLTSYEIMYYNEKLKELEAKRKLEEYLEKQNPFLKNKN
jgi:hypothetical protein